MTVDLLSRRIEPLGLLAISPSERAPNKVLVLQCFTMMSSSLLKPSSRYNTLLIQSKIIDTEFIFCVVEKAVIAAFSAEEINVLASLSSK
jgi:hypothetical protein